MLDYTITWLLCAFSLVVDRDLLKDTAHRWRQIHAISRQRTFLFSYAKILYVGLYHLNFYCIWQIDNILPYVCTVIDHRRRHKSLDFSAWQQHTGNPRLRISGFLLLRKSDDLKCLAVKIWFSCSNVMTLPWLFYRFEYNK